VIEWGDGIYGAEAAARTYFQKSAADLSPQESALLAGAIINPRVLDPGHPTARLHRRQLMVMRRMGAVTPPPVVAGRAPAPEPSQDAPGGPVPQMPDAGGVPALLPGEVVPGPTSPGGKPPGGDREP
jgi:transglycosylase-like protein